jgi:hypothetical protein
MEKVISIPIAIAVISTIIPILAFFYPVSFGITRASINLLTVFTPVTGIAIGLCIFLLTDILLLLKKSRKICKTIIRY